MSLEQWEEEYFRGSYMAVNEAAGQGAAAATQHSLIKWRGLGPEVLEQYGLIKHDHSVAIHDEESNTVFEADADECALCEYDNIKTAELGSDDMCFYCPLARSMGHVQCCELESPYQVWKRTGDNRPMVAALEATLTALEDGTVDLK